jgi:hypothetical protein
MAEPYPLTISPPFGVPLLDDSHQPRQAVNAAQALDKTCGGCLTPNFEYYLPKAAQHDNLPRNRQTFTFSPRSTAR